MKFWDNYRIHRGRHKLTYMWASGVESLITGCYSAVYKYCSATFVFKLKTGGLVADAGPDFRVVRGF